MYDDLVHSMDENLTRQNVSAIFGRYCLHPSDMSEGIVVDGLFGAVRFSTRIEMDRSFIHDMLAELPVEFGTEAGGDFQAACTTLFGVRWTNTENDVEMLAQLGAAVGEVEFCSPRSEWEGYPRFRRIVV